MAENPDFERRLADQAVRIFAEEWVLAVSPVLQTLQDNSKIKTDERRNFLRSAARLRNTHTHQITFMQILRALGNRIFLVDEGLHAPLCEIFNYFKDGHPNSAAYAGFDFHVWVARRSAG
jgi:hypothetical protein